MSNAGLVEFHEHPRGCAQPNAAPAMIDAFAIIAVLPADHGGAAIEYERGGHSSYYYSIETAAEMQRRWRGALGLTPEQERVRNIVQDLPPPGPDEYYLVGVEPPSIRFPDDDLSLYETPPEPLEPTARVAVLRLPCGLSLEFRRSAPKVEFTY